MAHRTLPSGQPAAALPRTHRAWRAFQAPSTLRPACRQCTCRADTKERNDGATMDTNVGQKAVWYVAELLGKAVGGKGQDKQASSAPSKVLSRDEIVQSIKKDYDQNYFISGAADMEAYAEDCVFADPFTSFAGKQRFQQNVGNFATLLRNVKLEVFEFNQPSPDRVFSRWRFSCILDLPWKPRLAAAGNTMHILDLDKGLVVKHVETWETEPDKVIQQLFRPANKIPSNAWDTFFLSASEGDVPGVWLASTPLLVKLCAPVVVVSLTCKVITGEGLPGVALGAVEGVSWLLFVSALLTEVVKLVKSAVGGEGM